MKTPIPVFDTQQTWGALRDKAPFAHQQNYFAMYSSWLGGITFDPAAMMIPMDDHMVHRGDGIFEAIKVVGGKAYALEPHLDRLERSLDAVGMKLPLNPNQNSQLTRFDLTSLINECVAQGLNSPQASKVTDAQNGSGDALIRLFVSRGPGGFTTNPYESVGSQLYIVITALKPPSRQAYENGVRAIRSRVHVKEAPFATIKSCNYLPNVLMKKEAVDSEVDFTLSFDRDGFLGEGSTENCAIISSRGEFLIPPFTNTLRGITLMRAMEFATDLMKAGHVTQIRQTGITLIDLQSAREVILFGTTMDVLAITEFEGQAIGTGKPGPMFQNLLRLLRSDQGVPERSGA